MGKIMLNGVDYSSMGAGGKNYDNGTGGISAGTGLTLSQTVNYSKYFDTIYFDANNISVDGDANGFSITLNTVDTVNDSDLAAYVGSLFSEVADTYLASSGFERFSENGGYINEIRIIAPYQIELIGEGDSGYEYFSDGHAPTGTFIYTFYNLQNTVAPHQTLFGHYNKSNYRYDYTNASYSPALLEVGNGTASSKSNALRLEENSYLYLGSGGKYNASGADYAEYFEWLDGNWNAEDRRGRFVTLEGDKIRLAGAGDDFILGAVSRNASIIGNADMEWQGRFARDEFGEIIYEEAADENGDIRYVPKENPKYDPKRSYVSRAERKEWEAVGMLGVLNVIDNGLCEVDSYAAVGDGGTAVPAGEATAGEKKYKVIGRVSDRVVRIVFR